MPVVNFDSLFEGQGESNCFVYQFEKRECYCANEKRNVSRPSTVLPRRTHREEGNVTSASRLLSRFLFHGHVASELRRMHAPAAWAFAFVTYVRASVCAVTCKNGIAKT